MYILPFLHTNAFCTCSPDILILRTINDCRVIKRMIFVMSNILFTFLLSFKDMLSFYLISSLSLSLFLIFCWTNTQLFKSKRFLMRTQSHEMLVRSFYVQKMKRKNRTERPFWKLWSMQTVIYCENRLFSFSLCALLTDFEMRTKENSQNE